jgi:hypothetical protein
MPLRTLAPFLLPVLLSGCSPTPPSTPPDQVPPAPQPGAEDASAPSGGTRPSLSAEECAARGGVVVGDIGDGATHRPDYVCPSGGAPLGNVKPPAGGPVAIEGSVCCPK